MGVTRKMTWDELAKENSNLKAENEKLKEWLIKERMPHFCTGIDCGCIEYLAEARAKAKVRLQTEIEQALKNK